MTDEERTAWEDAIPDDTPFNRTDAGNGEHFARLYGDRAPLRPSPRSLARVGRALVARRRRGEVRLLAKARCAGPLPAGSRHRQPRGAQARGGLRDRQREPPARRGYAAWRARSEPPIADAGDRWDLDPWAARGDQRGGRPAHRRGAGGQARGPPDPPRPRRLRPRGDAARAGRRSSTRSSCGDEDLIDYVWRAVGYSLTGDIREQCLFMCHGDGLERQERVPRASYARSPAATPPTRPSRPSSSITAPSIPNDVAALVGRRLVTAAETGEGKRLQRGSPQGADRRRRHHGAVHARRVLHVRAGPEALARGQSQATGDATTRMASGVACGSSRSCGASPTLDKDEELADKLLAELPGILAWAVRGAVLWREEGLRTPETVIAATETYRVESDPLGDFIEAECVVGDAAVGSGRQPSTAAYQSWARREGLGDRETLSRDGLRHADDRSFRQAVDQQRQGLRRRRPAMGPPGRRQRDGSGDGS